jgi:hypothetical protein
LKTVSSTMIEEAKGRTLRFEISSSYPVKGNKSMLQGAWATAGLSPRRGSRERGPDDSSSDKFLSLNA